MTATTTAATPASTRGLGRIARALCISGTAVILSLPLLPAHAAQAAPVDRRAVTVTETTGLADTGRAPRIPAGVSPTAPRGAAAAAQPAGQLPLGATRRAAVASPVDAVATVGRHTDLPRLRRAAAAALGPVRMVRLSRTQVAFIALRADRQSQSTRRTLGASSTSRAAKRLGLTFIPRAAPQGFTNDPAVGRLWGLEQYSDIDMDLAQAFAQPTIRTGNAPIIAIIDTGVDFSHPDLAGRSWVNPRETRNGRDDDGNGLVDDMTGWDYYYGDANPHPAGPGGFRSPQWDHGTHVAGTAAASANNRIGITGVSPRSRIMALKVCGGRDGLCPGGSIAAAIRYAASNGAKVANVSIGDAGACWNGYASALSYARSRGMVVTISAGNDGRNIDVTPYSPVGCPGDNIIRVGSVAPDGRRAAHSNYGRTKVDVFAPGVSIYSTLPAIGTSTQRYASWLGTSMAAPHAAGLAALVFQQHPSWTPAQVRRHIMATTPTYTGLTGLAVRGGLINAGAATKTTVAATQPPGAPLGLRIVPSQPGSVTIAWNRPAGTTPISHYWIGRWNASTQAIEQVATVSGSTTSYDVGYLASDSVSSFAVYALAAGNPTWGPPTPWLSAASTVTLARYGAPGEDHYYTTDEALRSYWTITDGTTSWGYEADAGAVWDVQVSGSVPLYRLFEPGSVDHLYTASQTVRARAIQLGFIEEGIAAWVMPTQVAGTAGLYRYYSADATDHFATVDPDEARRALADGYVFQAVDGYIVP